MHTSYQAMLFELGVSKRGNERRHYEKVVDVVESDDLEVVNGFITDWLGSSFLKIELRQLRHRSGDRCDVLDTGVLLGAG